MPKIPIVSSIPEDPQIKGLLEGYDKVPAAQLVLAFVCGFGRNLLADISSGFPSPPLSLFLCCN